MHCNITLISQATLLLLTGGMIHVSANNVCSNIYVDNNVILQRSISGDDVKLYIGINEITSALWHFPLRPN